MDDIQRAIAHPLDEVVSSRKQQIWYRIASLHESMSDHDSAIAALDKVITINPSHTTAITKAGILLLFKSNYRQAARFLQRAINQQAENASAWAALAHCYVMTDDLITACRAYQSAISNSSDLRDPLLWFGIANLYDRVGYLEKALDAFEAVLEMAPMHPLRLDIYCSLALIHKERRNFDHALMYFRKITTEHTDATTLANALYHMAHIYELRSDAKQAVDTYSSALSRNPHHLKAYHGIAWLLHKSGKTEDATGFLQRAVQLSPTDAYTHYLMGRIAMTTKDYRTAYDSYQQAVYRDQKNPLFWCAIGVLYFHMQQHRDAMDAFSRAIHIDPNMPQVWHDMGILYEIYQQYPDAVDAYRRAASLNPNNAETTRRLFLAEQVISGNTAPPQNPQLTPDTDGPPVSPGPESVIRPHLNPEVLSRFAPFPPPPRAPPPPPPPPPQSQPQPQPHMNGVRATNPHTQQPGRMPLQAQPHDRVPVSNMQSAFHQPPTSNGPADPILQTRPTATAAPRVPLVDRQQSNGSLPPVSGAVDYHPRPLPSPQQQQQQQQQQQHHQQHQHQQAPPAHRVPPHPAMQRDGIAARPLNSRPLEHHPPPRSAAPISPSQSAHERQSLVAKERASAQPMSQRNSPRSATPQAPHGQHQAHESSQAMAMHSQPLPHVSGPLKTPLPNRPFPSLHAPQQADAPESMSQRSHPSQQGRNSSSPRQTRASMPLSASPSHPAEKKDWYRRSGDEEGRPYNHQSSAQEEPKHSSPYSLNRPHPLSDVRSFERHRDEKASHPLQSQGEGTRLTSPRAREEQDPRTVGTSDVPVLHVRRTPPRDGDRAAPDTSGEMSKRSISSSLDGKPHAAQSNDGGTNVSPNGISSGRGQNSEHRDNGSSHGDIVRSRPEGLSGVTPRRLPLNGGPLPGPNEQPRRMRSPDVHQSPRSGEKTGRPEVDEDMLPRLRPLPMPDANRAAGASGAAGSTRSSERALDGSRSEASRDRDSDHARPASRSEVVHPHEQANGSHFERRVSGNGRMPPGGPIHHEPERQVQSNSDDGRQAHPARSPEGPPNHSPRGDGNSRGEIPRSMPMGRDSVMQQRSPAMGPRHNGGDREYNGGQSSLTLLRSVPVERMMLGRSDRGRDEGHRSSDGPSAGGEGERRMLVNPGGGRDDHRGDSRFEPYRGGHSRRNSFDSARALNNSVSREDERRKSYDYSPRTERRRDGPVSPGRSRSADRYREPVREPVDVGSSRGGGDGAGGTGGHGDEGNVPFGSGAPTSFSKSLSRAGASSGLSTGNGGPAPPQSGANGMRADGYDGRYSRYHEDDRVRRGSPHDSEGSPRGRKRRYVSGGRRYDMDGDSHERGPYGGERMEMNGEGRDGPSSQQRQQQDQQQQQQGAAGNTANGVPMSRVSPGSRIGGRASDGDRADELNGRRPQKRLRGPDLMGDEGNGPRMTGEEVKTVD